MTFQFVITVGIASRIQLNDWQFLTLELDCNFLDHFLLTSHGQDQKSRPKREREGKNTIPLFIDFWGAAQ